MTHPYTPLPPPPPPPPPLNKQEEVLLGETRMAGLHQNFNTSIAEWHEELKTRHDTLDKVQR